MHFLKATTTPRTTEGNVSDENEMSDLIDSEEVISFSGSFNDTEDIQSTSNLLHDNISTSISNYLDTSFKKPSAIKRKKNKY